MRFVILSIFDKTVFKSLFIEVKFGISCGPIIFGVIYRPLFTSNNMQHGLPIDYSTEVLIKIQNKNNIAFIKSGDFNYNLLVENNRHVNDFKDCYFNLLIDKPTRILSTCTLLITF